MARIQVEKHSGAILRALASGLTRSERPVRMCFRCNIIAGIPDDTSGDACYMLLQRI